MIDLVFPILVLIVCCVIGMIYTGGFFSGAGIVEGVFPEAMLRWD